MGHRRYNDKQTAAHYKGVLAAAQDAQSMAGRHRAGGSGGKPPKKGCWLTAVMVMVIPVTAILFAVAAVVR